jgi:cyclic pyranopterin phosphate synthase
MMTDETTLNSTDKVRMADVGDKPDTEREATAKALVRMQPATLTTIQKGKLAKGDVLATAQIAGIMAAKNTPLIVPLCHPLLISNVAVGFRLDESKNEVEITATVKNTGKTGVEMEALTAVTASALTIYDMCKSIDPGMRIEGIRLTRKSGGKSGTVELE